MELLNSEHLTRYYVKYEDFIYNRLVSKSVTGEEIITWLEIIEETAYIVDDEILYNKLEKQFQTILN